jgi:excisionase family DNA binding protein
MQKQLIDSKSAADMLAIPLSDLLRLAKEKQISHYRFGHKLRFEVTDIQRFMAEMRVERREVKND